MENIILDRIDATDIIPIFAGFESCKKSYSFGPHIRNHYLLHYCLSGKGKLFDKFGEHSISKGELFVIRPGEITTYTADADDPWEYVWFHSLDPNAEKMFRFLQQDDTSNVFKYHDVSALENFASKIQLMNGACVSSAQMLEYFLHVFNAQFTPPPPIQKSLTETYFNYAIEYIFAHLSNKITVKDLTTVLGITQPYLYRIFQQKANKSPKQYIDSCKLNHAKTLLKETNMSVKQIAETVGYENPLVFSKFFSSSEKRSPSEYRKLAKNS
jgi:AraC-like DNA-binding protein